MDLVGLGAREPVQAVEQGRGVGPRPQARCPDRGSGPGKAVSLERA